MHSDPRAKRGVKSTGQDVFFSMRDNLTLFMKYYLDLIMLGVSIYLVVDLFTGVKNKCFTRHLYLADDGQSAHHDSKCLNWV